MYAFDQTRDYQQVFQDSSVTLGQGDCKFLLDSLEQVDNKELALAIVEDWTLRDGEHFEQPIRLGIRKCDFAWRLEGRGA